MSNFWVFKKFSILYVLALVITASCGVIISLAVCSYNAHDSSWFFVSTMSNPIHNIFGSFGAHLAALLFFLFGSAALLIGPWLLCSAYSLLFSSFKHEWDRIIACGILIISCAGLEYLYTFSIIRHGFHSGGAIGLVVYRGLHAIVDRTIISLFLPIMVIVSLILIFRFSVVIILSSYVHHFGFLGSVKKCVKPLLQLVSRAWTWILPLNSVNIEYDESLNQEELHHVLDDPIWATYGLAPTNESKQEQQADRVKHDEVTSASDEYRLPPVDIFKKHEEPSRVIVQEQETLARVLEEKLARFGVAGSVVSIRRGPVITLFEYQPHIDSKISKIIALEDDLALALQAMSIRIIAPIPGTSVVGFEVANKERESVLLSTILYSKAFTTFTGSLPLVIGVDTVGKPVIADLATMPHMLIAGATGSGKSVALNVMLLSLLYRCRPDELNLILIDPKRLEFAPYADIPHLIFPIVTSSLHVAPILQWLIGTMEDRYKKMAELGVRNIIDYNRVICKDNTQEKLPFIVVMIDELADIMMVALKDIEERIARIAQMARAAGIHLVVATQRPSVDVITGIIKANFPSRISFKVATKIDSRTILDAIGADKLLGKGDMLYLSTGSQIARMHGAYVSDKEIEQVASYIRSMRMACYQEIPQELSVSHSDAMDIDKELYRQVTEYIQLIDEISISLLQRKFRIGYNRSARVIDRLQAEGLIMPSQGGKMRKVIRS